MRLTENLKKLQEGLIGECVDVGHYRYFLIQDPKERTICAALFPERVLHHAVMNVTEPYFERKMIFDTYACRRDKGTDKAVERAFDFTRKSFWFLKLDIRKYFDSISHSVLLEILRTVFKDGQLLDLFQQIIETYQKTPGKGVPIGNLTSQYFANLYLSGFDHFIKDTLGIKRYVRYMDDMCLWGNNKLVYAMIPVKAAIPGSLE